MAKLFDPGTRGTFPSFGLLLLRVGAGGLMAVGHGWEKLVGWGEMKDTFYDPLGMGSQLSLASATAAELGCAALLVLGLATRIAALPLAFTMGVAAFVVHGADPLGDKELALVYLAAYLTLLFTGPGRFSVDAKLAGQPKK